MTHSWRTFGSPSSDSTPPPRQRRRVTDPPSGLVRRPGRRRTEPPPPAPPDRRVIDWLVNRCPECESRRIHTYATQHYEGFTMRHHRCACGQKWRSMDRHLPGEIVVLQKASMP